MTLKKTRSVSLTGIVIPVEWNEGLQVVAVALATSDEKEYRIADNRKGKELLGSLQRQVEVTGLLGIDQKGRAVMTVRRYIVK